MGGVLRWARDVRVIAGAVALAIVAAAVVVALRSGDDEARRIARPGTTEAPLASDGPAESPEPGTEAEPGGPGGASPTGVTGRPAASSRPGNETGRASTCRPKSVGGTGITDSEITIGQIVTDAQLIPQQFGPAQEGLRAFVERTNRTGGVCGRKLKLVARNDQGQPTAHRSDFQTLAGQVFAFVANESLFDGIVYQNQAPYNPTVTDDGRPVPDVGGLALSYSRSQSPWHAGVVGSVSPVLVGGGQFRYFADAAKRAGTPCRKAGVVYLREPTGASQDQAELGRVALERSWGASLGAGNTQLYAANLVDPLPAYEVMVDRMVADGMNCVFTYTDLASSVNLVRALSNRGVWPPASCNRGPQCFRVTYIPLSAFDQRFIQDAGAAASDVSTFVPHAPFNETSIPAMREYIDALKAVPGARPSTFSVLAYASGQMFVEAAVRCGGAPTRACVMSQLRNLKGFEASGLLGGTTPFRTTRVQFENYGTFDWKWIFHCTIALRVQSRGGQRDFHRVNPSRSFLCDDIRVARGAAR